MSKASVYVCNVAPPPGEEQPLVAPGTGIPVEWSSASRLIPAKPPAQNTTPDEEPLTMPSTEPEPQAAAEEIQKPQPHFGGQAESADKDAPEDPLTTGPGIFGG